jgi:hypothetical protein
MMVSTTPAWGMEPTTSSLGAMSPYHQANVSKEEREMDIEREFGALSE